MALLCLCLNFCINSLKVILLVSGGGDNNLPSEETGNDTPPSRESETSAILSFVQYFSTNFSNRGITFLTCCLEDAFTQAFETSIQRVTRKFVIGKIA
jgi:hypothetical protein